MKDIVVSNSLSGRHTDAVADLLVQPRLWVSDGDYPGHMTWRDKALAQIAAGEKLAMVGWWGGEPVATCVYQLDPKDPLRVEIKNLSIERHARGRGFGPFVLRQVLCEAPVEFPGARTAIADVKVTNPQMLRFLHEERFTVLGATMLDGPLPHNGVADLVVAHDLVRPVR